MSIPRDDHSEDDEQPYVLGLSEQPAAPEVVRIEPARAPGNDRRPPDLAEEEIRREVTVRTVQNRGPEQTWTEGRKRLPSLRAIALAVLVSLIVISGSLLAVRLVGKRQEAPPAITPPPREARSFFESATAQELESSALATVQGFMNATTPVARSRFVLGGEAQAERIRAFYERPGSPAPERFGRVLQTEDVALEGHPVKIVFAAEENGTVGWSFVLVGLRDRLVIDWEASVAYGQLPWSTLLRDQPRQPVQMRVFLKRVTLESGHPANHHLYRLSTRGTEETLLAAVPAESPMALQLARTVPTAGSQPANIRLRWPPRDSPLPYPEITELIHNFWIDAARIEEALQAPPEGP